MNLEYALCDVYTYASNLHLGLLLHRLLGIHITSLAHCDAVLGEEESIPLDPAVDEIEAMLRLRPLFEDTGLRCMLNVFPYELGDMAELLDLGRALDACLVNVIGGVTPLTVSETVPVVERWMADARNADLPLLFETHRDSTLNDLYFTLQLIERVPEMRLCGDLSHFVLDREMRLPLRDRDRDYMNRIIERSDCLQGRVASREQIQVQFEFPQHRDWFEQFKAWWRFGMEDWSARSPDDAELVFLCELGPPPYAMTDARGEELSDRWQEALALRKWALQTWSRIDPAQSGR